MADKAKVKVQHFFQRIHGGIDGEFSQQTKGAERLPDLHSWRQRWHEFLQIDFGSEFETIDAVDLHNLFKRGPALNVRVADSQLLHFENAGEILKIDVPTLSDLPRPIRAENFFGRRV